MPRHQRPIEFLERPAGHQFWIAAVGFHILAPVDAAATRAGSEAERPGATATLPPRNERANADSQHGGSGAQLLDTAGIDVLKQRLIPRAFLVTPNLPETEALGAAAQRLDQHEVAARRLNSVREIETTGETSGFVASMIPRLFTASTIAESPHLIERTETIMARTNPRAIIGALRRDGGAPRSHR